MVFFFLRLTPLDGFQADSRVKKPGCLSIRLGEDEVSTSLGRSLTPQMLLVCLLVLGLLALIRAVQVRLVDLGLV